MNQQPSRKEPTFGEPTASATVQTSTTPEKTAQPKTSLSFSLHSNQSPGHTFTPVMTRPSEIAKDFSTLEEQKMLQNQKPTPPAQPNSGFAFTPVEKAVTTPTEQPVPQAAATPVSNPAKVNTAAQETAATTTTKGTEPTIERVIPTASAQPAAKKPSVGMPSKYRRLILVALLALALLLVFFLLKPKAPETVEDLQEQGSSLPIEFRPVDEAEAKRAEEEAKALLEQQQQAAEAQAAQSADNNANVSSEPNSTANTDNQATVAAPSVSTVSVAQSEPTPTATIATPVVNKPLVIEPIKKPNTGGSVIYQPENNKTDLAKLEKAKPTTTVKTETVKAAASTSQPTTLKKAEPKAMQPTAVTKPATTTAVQPAAPAASVKTITVQKGVSLFQNFRDNGLEANLPELNKMTKLNGETSRLSPGQKITVRLDANKRIVEMNIGSGKYIRQSDGSYLYK